MSTAPAQMGWNPESPTNELRVSLLANLRGRLRQLEDPPKIRPSPWWTYDGLAIATEIIDLRRWIAWLDGAEVKGAATTEHKEEARYVRGHAPARRAAAGAGSCRRVDIRRGDRHRGVRHRRGSVAL
jgi:hypothetical protein